MRHYRLFSPFEEILAFTTEKSDFADGRPRFTGHPEHATASNRKELAMKLGIPESSLVFPDQRHSGNVAAVDRLPAGDLSGTDALVTNLPGICLCIETADCVPVLIYDPVRKATGAVHAGWRGTLAGITRETVSRMIRQFASSSRDLYAVIGPSISPGVYETGDEVATLFMEQSAECRQSVFRGSSGKYHLDLWKANELQLLSMGIPLNQTETARRCSFTGTDTCFSARREGIHTGRMVSGIVMLW